MGHSEQGYEFYVRVLGAIGVVLEQFKGKMRDYLKKKIKEHEDKLPAGNYYIDQTSYNLGKIHALEQTLYDYEMAEETRP